MRGVDRSRVDRRAWRRRCRRGPSSVTPARAAAPLGHRAARARDGRGRRRGRAGRTPIASPTSCGSVWRSSDAVRGRRRRCGRRAGGARWVRQQLLHLKKGSDDDSLPDAIQLHARDVGEAGRKARRTAGRQRSCTSSRSGARCTDSGTRSADHDGYTLWEAPDNVSMAAVALAITSGGALSSFETTVLLTIEETIEALGMVEQIKYRPPGA